MNNTPQKTFLMCMGTRPEIIKMAPIYHEMDRRGLKVILLHTGQHVELAMPMYEFFGITPDFNLELNRQHNSLEHLSALLIESIGKIISDVTPSAVLVHGDTSTALMAALAAFYHKVPVCHVEAGLRTFNSYDPFPEEKNRELIARLSQWHFSPTIQASNNLQREGISTDQVYVVGNTSVDAVAIGLHQLEKHAAKYVNSPIVEDKLQNRRLILVTAHRRENWNGPLKSIAQAVMEIAQEYPDVVVVWPVHANPIIQNIILPIFENLPDEVKSRVFMVEPLAYPELLKLLAQSWLVMTDSGGIQEEAATLDKPILVLRNTTERPELIEVGGGILVGTEQADIVNAVRDLRTDPDKYQRMQNARNPFGDGTTAAQIVDVLLLNPTNS
jgi:UDP-N-acetylglucosamine 2-epimerase (non-hydrolysing)